VQIHQNYVGSLGKLDYFVNIVNQSGTYIVGEQVTQTINIASQSTLNLTTQSSFIAGESIYQVNSIPSGTYVSNTTTSLLVANTGTPNFTTTFTAGMKVVINGKDIRVVNNVVSSTQLYLSAAPSNANTFANIAILQNLGVAVSTPTSNIIYFANTGNTAWNVSANVYGSISQNTSTLSAILPYAFGTAIGKVAAVNSTSMQIRRLSVTTDFSNTGLNIIGALSLAQANITSVAANTSSAPAGDNANVTAQVVTSNGTVSGLTVQTSGIGYINGESVSFYSADGLRVGTAFTVLGQQGVGQGYYSSTKGFTSADKYIQDGYFYQNFAYEIISSLDVSKYYDMVRAVVHTAGTALYGAVIKKSLLPINVNVINSNTGPQIG